MKNISHLSFLLFVLSISLGFQSCDEEEIEAAMKTYHVTNVTSSSAKVRGKISVTAGNPKFTESGICISTTQTYPRITNSKVIYSAGSLTDFELSLTGLSPDSVYKFRAFASTADTIFYGLTYSFRPVDINIQTVNVSGGTFTMGATSEQLQYASDIEKPAHSVTLDNFEVGKYEVTNSQYVLFLNSRQINSTAASMTKDGVSYKMIYTSPKGLYYDSATSSWKSPAGYENNPVVNVTWYGANEFCLWAGGRLLTEAEWEFAARGGKSTAGSIYSGSNTTDLVAWYKPNIYENESLEYYTQPVGGKNANELGIFDMSGNVWEWCSDWYSSYSSASVSNPTGPSDEAASAENSEIIYKVRRGGGWADPDALSLRVSNRGFNVPTANAGSIGFRFGR